MALGCHILLNDFSNTITSLIYDGISRMRQYNQCHENYQ